MRDARLLLSAPASGSGKTIVTCALLEAFRRRGHTMAACKCGPDFIDPMFHQKVLGAPSRNLDPFFCDADGLLGVLYRQAAGADITLIEGVMGYYDGLGGISCRASTYDVARKTGTPVILVADAGKASVSLAAHLKGLLEFRSDSGIAGVVLNRVQEARYKSLRSMIDRELPVPVCGYIPPLSQAQLESRYLGLFLPDEVADLRARIGRIADVCEQTLDLRLLEQIARQADPLPKGAAPPTAELRQEKKVRIGVAQDAAFCFYYPENLELLEAGGAELVPFSPLRDTALPGEIGGLLFGGGYPEQYAAVLEDNQAMRRAVCRAVQGGMPTVAECGGFLYLQQGLTDAGGVYHEMAGALPGTAHKTERLQRFGYVTLCAQQAQLAGDTGTQIRGHEFHYYDSTENGAAFRAQKPTGTAAWDCIQGSAALLAGFPHLYYPSNPQVPAHFRDAAEAFLTGRKRRTPA